VVLDATVRPEAIGEVERVLAASERRGLVRAAVLHLLSSGGLVAKMRRVLDVSAVVEAAEW
jgi:hypothetical protein